MTLAKDSTLKSGAVRGRTGPLVLIPLDNAAFKASNSTLSKNSGTGNPDGTGSQVSFSQAPFTGATAVAFWKQRIQGTTVGIRWRSEDGTTTQVQEFDVVVDGICYPVENTIIRYDNALGSAGGTYQDERRIIAENLPDGDHTVQLIFVGNTDGASTRTLTMYGYMADNTRGFIAPPPAPRTIGVLPSPSVIPTSPGAVPFSTNSSAGLTFVNPDGASHTVTIYGPDGTSQYGPPIVLAAGAGYFLTFTGGPRSMSGWKWKVDSGTSVYGWVENA